MGRSIHEVDCFQTRPDFERSKVSQNWRAIDRDTQPILNSEFPDASTTHQHLTHHGNAPYAQHRPPPTSLKIMPKSTASVSAAALVGLFALASGIRPGAAFLLPPSSSKPASTTTTRLAAHSHLQAALHLMQQQQGPSGTGNGRTGSGALCVCVAVHVSI